ncbi:MAG: hypothetical protein ABI812_02285 [Betaproteobacteria bacterium]
MSGQGAAAATLDVGPGAPYRSVAAAAAAARDGDTIEIAAGTYREDVAVFTQKRLTIRGVGGRVVLNAAGRVAEGKAIFVLRDGDYAVEGLEFRGARADDQNGAGIRFERGKLAVRRCTFADNENGILTGNDAAAELLVEDSEFSQAPRDRGALKHLLYVGRIARFAITGSRLHQAFDGHLVKSRARTSDVRYNLLYDGPEGRAAYELEFPNGGKAIVVGNVIGQSATTTNPVVVSFGAEGAVWPDNALYLVHNTLVSDRRWGAWFLRVFPASFPGGVPLVAVNNLTVGAGIFSLGASGTFAGNFPVFAGSLGDLATLDFTLGKGSWLRGSGETPPSLDGVSLAPTREFRLPVGTRDLAPQQTWTPGAFQSLDPRR